MNRKSGVHLLKPSAIGSRKLILSQSSHYPALVPHLLTVIAKTMNYWRIRSTISFFVLAPSLELIDTTFGNNNAAEYLVACSGDEV